MNVAAVLDAAEAHLANGRDAAAQTLFAEVVEHPAGAVRALAGLGGIALRAGDTERSRELFARALALAPENAELLVGLATAYQVGQRTEDAETCLRRAMRLDPALVDAPLQLALLALARHDVDDARALAQRAVKLAPDSIGALTALAHVEIAGGDADKAVALFERILDLSPGNVNALSGLGMLRQMAGDLAGAAEALETARLKEPDSPHILARLAACRSGLGALESAHTLVRQAAALAPADAEVRNTEGVILLNRGRFDEALAALRAAAEHDPASPAPLVNLALLLRRRNAHEAALATARQAISRAPEPDEAASRIAADLLCLAGNWREGWRRYDVLAGVDSPPQASAADFGPRVALMVGDLSAALMSLPLLPRLAAGRRLRLLCLPAYAGFFRVVPGIASVHARETIDLSKDIETGETTLLLDDLARILRATPADLPQTPLGLRLDGVPPPSGMTNTASRTGAGDASCAAGEPGSPQGVAPGSAARIGLWWSDAPDGPEPRDLLDALPASAALLREPRPDQTRLLSDSSAPQVLVKHDVEDLADMARTLLSLDRVVAVDGPVAHLAACLGCRTLVICQYDVPWYWQPCGPERLRWYPTAEAVGRDLDGAWSSATEACARFGAGTSDSAAPDA